MVSDPSWIPARGEVVWLDFSPQVGFEQAGRRPAVVVSATAYNGRVGLALVCPVTRQAKGYPFEVPLPVSSGLEGVVLADQVKSLDWHRRNAQPVAMLPKRTIEEILEKITLLLTG